MDKRLRRDLQILAKFITVYCRNRHKCAPKAPVRLPSPNLENTISQPGKLCPECGKLLAHAVVKRIHCPIVPKPSCKHCPDHCYEPRYRERIREVMKYSGRRLVLMGRLDYLWHLLS